MSLAGLLALVACGSDARREGQSQTALSGSDVQLASPADGQWVNAPTEVKAAVGPDISWVNFYVDGDYLRSSPPYGFTWDPSSVSQGSHVISVRGYDRSSAFVGAAQATISTSAVVVTSPTNGSAVSGSVTLSAASQPNVSWLDFYVDGTYLSSSPPYSRSWDSSSVPDGSHVLSVNAYDRSSAQVGTAQAAVVVSNGSPSPSPSPGVTGTAYYVARSSACSDSNAGTSASRPFCSVARAMQQQSSLSPGDGILFRCGDTWDEQFDLANVHGASGHPIIIGHYGAQCVLPKFLRRDCQFALDARKYPGGHPEWRFGAPEWSSGAPEWPSGPPEWPSGPPECPSGPPEWPSGPPECPIGAPEWPNGPPECPIGARKRPRDAEIRAERARSMRRRRRGRGGRRRGRLFLLARALLATGGRDSERFQDRSLAWERGVRDPPHVADARA